MESAPARPQCPMPVIDEYDPDWSPTLYVWRYCPLCNKTLRETYRYQRGGDALGAEKRAEKRLRQGLVAHLADGHAVTRKNLIEHLAGVPPNSRAKADAENEYRYELTQAVSQQLDHYDFEVLEEKALSSPGLEEEIELVRNEGRVY